MLGQCQDAPGDDAGGACRRRRDDDAHGCASLEHRHGLGGRGGLDLAQKGETRFFRSRCYALRFAAQKSAERRCGVREGRAGLLAHDVEGARHGGTGALLADEAMLA